jgi:hypothetical protein
VQRRLETLISDVNAPDVARLNTPSGPEVSAGRQGVFRLMNLLDNPHPGLAAESRQALELSDKGPRRSQRSSGAQRGFNAGSRGVPEQPAIMQTGLS